MKRMDSVPYIRLEIQLHGCVEKPEEFSQELRRWLISRLEPDYDSDIEVEIIESAGWQRYPAYDVLWLLEKIQWCIDRWGKSSKKDIFRGSYDVWSSEEDMKRQCQIPFDRLNCAKDLGLIINESGKDEWTTNENWNLTDKGKQYLKDSISDPQHNNQ